MVERVKITPSKILLKDADGNIKFDTDNLYLKTGSGTLYAGGNVRTPAIYGQNSVIDHTDSGFYTPGLFSPAVNFEQANNKKWVYNVPKSSSLRIRFSDDWETYGNQLDAPSQRTLQYYNYNTLQLVDLPDYKYIWTIARVGKKSTKSTDNYGAVSYGQWYTAVWPVFLNVPPPPTNPAGGTYEILWTANEHLTWSKTVTGVGAYGVPFSNTYTFNSFFGEGTTINWRTHGMFTDRAPEALALAVTP